MYPWWQFARDIFAYFYTEWSSRGGHEEVPEAEDIHLDDQVQVVVEDASNKSGLHPSED